MTKLQLWLCFFLGVFLIVQCSTTVKVEYDLDSFDDAYKEEFLTYLDHGKKLYKTHCSDCHGIFTAGKENITNFSQEQFDNYTTRFLARDPTNHALVANMTADELQRTIWFLKFLKRDALDKK